jgi:hypothetical protein
VRTELQSMPDVSFPKLVQIMAEDELFAVGMQPRERATAG